MTPKTYIINSQKAIGETIDGETIVINLETGSYYSMNQAGTAVWNAFMTGTPVDTDEKSVADFLATMLEDELVVETAPSDRAPASIEGTPTIEKYVDMQEMLLADPIHDVDTAGWPKLKEE